ncbi:hypothetical protein [Dulcicalothrix desertica]|nr:hypothetical protein [Dulcicalothrix desertica]
MLRRCEISKLKVGDFNYQESMLRVFGKVKGNDDVVVDLNRNVAARDVGELEEVEDDVDPPLTDIYRRE